MTEIGIPTTPQQAFDNFTGTRFMDIEKYIADQLGEYPGQSFEDAYRARSAIVFKEELQAIEGVFDLLDNLNGQKTCVASNGPGIKMNITLEVTGLRPYFPEEHVFSAYDIQKWKPDPTLFLHAAKQMGVEPEACVVIEDSYNGAMGGINAGIETLAYNPHGLQDLKSLDIPNFSTMADIQSYLTGI